MEKSEYSGEKQILSKGFALNCLWRIIILYTMIVKQLNVHTGDSKPSSKPHTHTHTSYGSPHEISFNAISTVITQGVNRPEECGMVECNET